MRSIRGYLVTRLVGSITAVLVLAGMGVYVLVGRSIERQFDQALEERVSAFASILFQVKGQVEFVFSEQLMPEFAGPEPEAYFELWLDDGTELERSEGLTEGHLPLRELSGSGPHLWSAKLPDGRPGRYIAERVLIHHLYPEDGPEREIPREVLIAIARSTGQLNQSLSELLLYCSAVCLALVASVVLLTRFAVDRGLGPAERLAGAVDLIRVDQLPEGLRIGELPEELRPIAEKTDALISRVQLALERERRTSADIAHELRTPLSELLTMTEVALRDPELAEEARSTLVTVGAIVGRLGRSVSTLLALARVDAGTEITTPEEIHLLPFLEGLVGSYRSALGQRDLTLRMDVDPDATVQADPNVLRIILSNLVGNAVTYASTGGILRIGFRVPGAGWELCVENPVEGLEEADLAHLTEPFWRKDSTRTDPNRSGLGLALSNALASRAGHELRFEQAGAVFRACLRG